MRKKVQGLCFRCTYSTISYLLLLYPKFQAFNPYLGLYRPVCVGPGRKPGRPVFSRCGSYIAVQMEKKMIPGKTTVVIKLWKRVLMVLYDSGEQLS